MSLLIQNLTFAYGKRPVLQGVSLEAKPGELVALLGPNGAGKTTLFSCVLGLRRSYGGAITLDGAEVKALSPRSLAHRVAAIPQVHPLSFRYRAFDMVLMGTSHTLSPLSLPGEREKAAAREAMEKLGIYDLAQRPFDQLSGGEQQLVFIARALAQQAKILLMDEPTSSLDYGNQLLVLDTVRALAREGYTVLLSTHNPQHALWYAQRVVALKAGQVLFQGSPEEVMTEEGLQALYGRPIALLNTPQGPMLAPKEAE